jgi:hypothetical protein
MNYRLAARNLNSETQKDEKSACALVIRPKLAFSCVGNCNYGDKIAKYPRQSRGLSDVSRSKRLMGGR